MQYVRLLSLPKLKFAHVFGADKYDNVLKKNPEGFIEVSYIKEGEMRKFHNGEWFCRREGDIFCNTFVHETRVSTDAWHEHHTVGFSVLMEYSPTEKAGFLPLPEHLPYSVESQRAIQLIDEIIAKEQNHGVSPLVLNGLFLQLLGEISALAQTQTSEQTAPSLYYVHKAKAFIKERLTKPITQKEIAAHLHITPQYLCQLFKSATGETVISYINRTKLNRIRILIERENVKLYQAAELYGYADPNYVSRLYKKYYGHTITHDHT